MSRNRTVYCKDTETWDKAKEIAELLGTTLSDVILRHLQDYVEKNKFAAATIMRTIAETLTK